jgi:hypothetical protein
MNTTTRADETLWAINKTIMENPDIKLPPFVLAWITSNKCLILTTNLTTKATAYELYLQMIANAVSNLNPVETWVNEWWSTFLQHNVPTHADLNLVHAKIEASYPSLHLGQTPCWLVPTEKHVNKAASSLVMTFIGAMNYKYLGTTSIAVCNHLYHIEEYFSWSLASQYKNCQEYSHYLCLWEAL